MSKSKSFFKYISMHFVHIYNERDDHKASVKSNLLTSAD